MSNKLTNSKGFTLIEIVIVLAIAALILVGVFLAVSGAQASRRDAQRKQNAARVLAAVEQWAGNHNGSYPTTAAEATALESYVKNNVDPGSGTEITLAPTGVPTATTTTVSGSFICNAGFTALAAGTARQAAVVYYTEQGGPICIDNR